MTATTNILKCMIGLSDGMIVTCDGIKHAGKLWLVPYWIEIPAKRYAMPERIIRFDNFPHHAAPADLGLDYLNIQLPIPETALRGAIPSYIEHEDRPQNLRVDIHLIRGH